MVLLLRHGPIKIAIGRLSVPARFNQFFSRGRFQSLLVAACSRHSISDKKIVALLFFSKHPGALGSHLKFWMLTGLNADEVVREVSECAILRHSHHTHSHTPQHPWENPR